MPIPVRMTVIQLRAGGLILHSPGPLAPALREELDALGPVAFIVVPQMHGRFAGRAAKAYPSARVLAAPAAPSLREPLAFHASLADQPVADTGHGTITRVCAAAVRPTAPGAGSCG